MNKSSTSLPQDVKSLTKLVLKQREELALKQAQLDHKSNYIYQLIEAIQLARQHYFGSRGQKVDAESNQMSWLFNEPETIADNDSDDSSKDAVHKKTSARKGGSQETAGPFPAY